MPKRHLVRLTEDQRAELDRWEASPLTRRQHHRALILLWADAGETDEEIVEEVGVSLRTVATVRRRFVEGGLDAALRDKPRPGAVPIPDGKAQAIVIAIACSPVPGGRVTWTARDEFVSYNDLSRFGKHVPIDHGEVFAVGMTCIGRIDDYLGVPVGYAGPATAWIGRTSRRTWPSMNSGTIIGTTNY